MPVPNPARGAILALKFLSGVAIMSSDRIHLSVDEARALGERALRGIGYDAEEACIIADHVIDAALCGYEYSGLAKILNIPEHRRFAQPRQQMRILHETPVSALYDGGNNVGMVAMYHAANAAIAKAEAHGISVDRRHQQLDERAQRLFRRDDRECRAGRDPYREQRPVRWRPMAAPGRCSAPTRSPSRYPVRTGRWCWTWELRPSWRPSCNCACGSTRNCRKGWRSIATGGRPATRPRRATARCCRWWPPGIRGSGSA